MGEAFEHEYGRMSGFLGVETPNAQAGLQNMILHRLHVTADRGPRAAIELRPARAWNAPIAHGGRRHTDLEVHPQRRGHPPDPLPPVRRPAAQPGRLGRHHPQARRQRARAGRTRCASARSRTRSSPCGRSSRRSPRHWGGLPNSIRLLDPSMPEGEMLPNTTQQEAAGLPIFAFNPDGEPIDVVNHYVNFGWEYVLPLPHPQPRGDGHDARPGRRREACSHPATRPSPERRAAARTGATRHLVGGQLEERDGLRRRTPPGRRDELDDPRDRGVRDARDRRHYTGAATGAAGDAGPTTTASAMTAGRTSTTSTRSTPSGTCGTTRTRRSTRSRRVAASRP